MNGFLAAGTGCRSFFPIQDNQCMVGGCLDARMTCIKNGRFGNMKKLIVRTMSINIYVYVFRRKAFIITINMLLPVLCVFH